MRQVGVSCAALGSSKGGAAEDLSSAHKAGGWGLAPTGGWDELLLLTISLNCS